MYNRVCFIFFPSTKDQTVLLYTLNAHTRTRIRREFPGKLYTRTWYRYNPFCDAMKTVIIELPMRSFGSARRHTRVYTVRSRLVLFFFLRIVHNSELLSFPSRPQPAEGIWLPDFLFLKTYYAFRRNKIDFFLMNRVSS